MSENNVVPLNRNGDVLPNEPVVAVIKHLRELLQMAEAGEIRGVAYVYLDGAGRSTTGWQTGDSHAGHLVGGVARLQFNVCRSWEDCAVTPNAPTPAS